MSLRNFQTPSIWLFQSREIEAIAYGLREPNQGKLAILLNEVNQLNRLINVLFSLSVNELQYFECQSLDLDIVPLLRACLDGMQAKRVEKQIEVNVDFLSAQHHIKGDVERISQLFYNLVNNGCTYTSSPG